MKQSSIKAILSLFMVIISFNLFASSGVLVSQSQFEKKLGCKRESKGSICFNRAIKYSHPDAYMFEFTVNFDLDESKVIEAIDLSIKQTSTMLNPLTAKFYQYDSPLIEFIDQTKFSAADIIVSFVTHNRGTVYSSYFLPLVEREDVVLFHGTFLGEISIYQILKGQCDEYSMQSIPYRYKGNTCILQYK